MGIHPVMVAVFLAFTGAGAGVFFVSGSIPVAGALFLCAVLAAISLRVAKQWQVAVVLRLGKFHVLKGPGLFFLFPFLDTVAEWIDTRTMSTPFNAEQTLTRDSVPIDVDAVLFWRVIHPEKAALEVAGYKEAIFWASQTALRDVMGKTDIAELLVGRERIDSLLQEIIHRRTGPWGIEVLAVEIRDVTIPESLQDAMSAQARAERERQARVILANSEQLIADAFHEAARRYIENPVALQLRAMNVLLEGMREGATTLVVPSSTVETMGLGTNLALAALSQGSGVRSQPVAAAATHAGADAKPQPSSGARDVDH